MTWSADAPANIALIKYMGKSADNIPLNVSLSFTLDKFKSRVELDLLEKYDGHYGGQHPDEWDPSQEINDSDRDRFLKHLSFLKERFRLRAGFRVRSSNDFPSHCGLASSASSFAALTKAAAVAASKIQGQDFTGPELISQLSRRGSGSSCRSLFSPFAVWDDEGTRPIDVGHQTFLHQVVVVDSSRKDVSSSEAHQRVLSSTNWRGRVARAEERFENLVESLKHNRWRVSFEIVWAEFWDMHALFETSQPPFGYMKPGSLEVLNQVRALWNKEGDGPLATMDAGPNVHLLYRADQRRHCERFRKESLAKFEVLGEGER